MPALPLDEAGKYVAGAYVVFLGLVLVYVAIMAAKLSRLEREVTELDDALRARDEAAGGKDAEGLAASRGAGEGARPGAERAPTGEALPR